MVLMIVVIIEYKRGVVGWCCVNVMLLSALVCCLDDSDCDCSDDDDDEQRKCSEGVQNEELYTMFFEGMIRNLHATRVAEPTLLDGSRQPREAARNVSRRRRRGFEKHHGRYMSNGLMHVMA